MAVNAADEASTRTTVAVGGPVLLGFADALAAPEAVASLLAAGLQVVAFTRRGNRPALRRERRIGLHAITGPGEHAAQAVSELVELARVCGAVALMPLDDASLWLCDRASVDLDLPVIGPTGDQAALALDKSLQVAAAGAAGLPVPATRLCTTREDLLALADFPLVLKPALAVTIHDRALARGSVRVCADAGELAAAVAGLDDGHSPVLAQPLVRGTGEGLFGIAVDGEVRHWSAHRRLRMVNPQGSGSSACTSIPLDPRLVEPAQRMMHDAGWNGLFMLEFLRDCDQTPWFMELNGRTWGSLALARRLGLEYPAWAARAALGIAPVPDVTPATAGAAPVVCRHLGREVIHVLSVLRGPRSAALADWPSRWGTIRDVARIRRGERWYNWSARHPGVFVDDTIQTLLDPFTKLRKRR